MDTEFTDFPGVGYDFVSNKFGKDYTCHNMISIALYGGSEELTFYGELSDYPKYYSSDFVKMHVEPLLTGPVYDTEGMRNCLRSFLYQFADQGVELMYDSGYDWDLFNNLMREVIPFVRGRNVAGRIDREKFEAFFVANPEKINHHALWDTQAQYVSYDPNLK
jgi:hypothetical protein